MMYSLLAAQDDRLPVHVFAGEATWLDAEVVVLREHVQRVGTREWALCAERVSAVSGSPGRSENACANYYRDNNFVEAPPARRSRSRASASDRGRGARVDTASRDPPHFVRRRPRPHEIAC